MVENQSHPQSATAKRRLERFDYIMFAVAVWFLLLILIVGLWGAFSTILFTWFAYLWLAQWYSRIYHLWLNSTPGGSEPAARQPYMLFACGRHCPLPRK